MIKRKINVLVVCICLLIVLIIAIFYFYPENDISLDVLNKENNTNTNNNKDFYSTNTITMLRETGIDTNTYEEITDSTWLDETYEYNSEKSNCTNGSNVSWDNETKQVIVEANRPDACYVYFDKIS